MIGGATAFEHFKQLARGLKDFGFEVREQDEFGEFGINGFYCSYRYFGVLDVDLLRPGQKLLAKQEPDMILTWDGKGWRDIADEGVSEVSRPTQELFNRCLKKLNYEVAATLGFSPSVCILLPPH